MSILRIYDPSECDDEGKPLDWERCRKCKGDKMVWSNTPGAVGSGVKCDRCDGHGSLRAAALAYCAERQRG